MKKKPMKIRMPYRVSLALILAYGSLMAFVPTTPNGLSAMVWQQDVQRQNAESAELVMQAKSQSPKAGNAQRSLQ